MDPFSKGGDAWAGNMLAAFSMLMAIAAVAARYLPVEWIRSLRSLGNRVTNMLDPFCYYTIREFTGQNPDQNYELVKQYLSGKGTANARRYAEARA